MIENTSLSFPLLWRSTAHPWWPIPSPRIVSYPEPQRVTASTSYSSHLNKCTIDQWPCGRAFRQRAIGGKKGDKRLQYIYIWHIPVYKVYIVYIVYMVYIVYIVLHPRFPCALFPGRPCMRRHAYKVPEQVAPDAFVHLACSSQLRNVAARGWRPLGSTCERLAARGSRSPCRSAPKLLGGTTITPVSMSFPS